jgi:hypothetical protein
MMTLEIRFDSGALKVRLFGSGDLNRWTILRPGEVDRLTGWSYDELRRLGEGLWAFPQVSPQFS